MITSVTTKNFKAIRNQTIDLERLTVFVGANGCGKSTVLQAVDVAVYVGTSVGPTDEWFVGERHCDWLVTRGESSEIAIECETSDGVFGFSCTLESGESQLLGTRHWKPVKEFGDGVTLDVVRRHANPVAFLRLDERHLAEPNYSESRLPRIECDGRGLASVLAYMSLNSPDSFEDLQGHMRVLIPGLDRIRFDKTEVRKQVSEVIRTGPDTTVETVSTRYYQGDTLLFDFRGAKDIPAHAVSEGTLVLLGILAALLGPARPKVLLLDDIERGLHPAAQHKLLDTLNTLLARFPELQILATAHSPYLLDRLPPEQVRIMCLDDQGHAACGRLSDHPQFERWKDEMAPGEMWSLFGERWLTEGASAK